MKKLTLKKETLSELTDDQLRSIAGGGVVIGGVSGTCYTCAGQYTCYTCPFTTECPSNDTQCYSVDGCTDSCTYRELCDRTIAIHIQRA